MNEVTKLYENAGVEPKKKCYYWDCPYSTGMPAKDIPYAKRNCQDCNNPDKAVYPPFTAEKQLKIMELLGEVHAFFDADKTNFACITNYRIEKGIIKGYAGKGRSVSEALAGLINSLWQDLTEEEKQQIKNILEEVRE